MKIVKCPSAISTRFTVEKWSYALKGVVFTSAISTLFTMEKWSYAQCELIFRMEYSSISLVWFGFVRFGFKFITMDIEKQGGNIIILLFCKFGSGRLGRFCFRWAGIIWNILFEYRPDTYSSINCILFNRY